MPSSRAEGEPDKPVEWFSWKYDQAKKRARAHGYELPRCAGDILVLLCHRDDETRREAEENFVNTLKTVERLNASDVAHVRPAQSSSHPILFNEAINYPENLITKVSGRKGTILRLNFHGKYKVVQDQDAVDKNTPVQISPQQVKDLYLAIRAAGHNEFVHPDTKSTSCLNNYQPYNSLPFWKMFPTIYQHQMIRDSTGNKYPVCWNKGDCDVRSLVFGCIALLADSRHAHYDSRKLVEKLAIVRAFPAQKMSVANMWYNLSAVRGLEVGRRHEEIWTKATERVRKNPRYADLLDITKFEKLHVTMPATAPVYKAKVKGQE